MNTDTVLLVNGKRLTKDDISEEDSRQPASNVSEVSPVATYGGIPLSPGLALALRSVDPHRKLVIAKNPPTSFESLRFGAVFGLFCVFPNLHAIWLYCIIPS